MFFAMPEGGFETILFGLGILAAGLLLRRSMLLSRRSRQDDVVGDVRKELGRRENSQSARIQRMEVRLLELTRELEGRLATRQEVLDQLIAQADERIARLRFVLGEHPAHDGDRTDRSFILSMSEAGFDADAIASCLDASQTDIQAILDDPSAAA